VKTGHCLTGYVVPILDEEPAHLVLVVLVLGSGVGAPLQGVSLGEVYEAELREWVEEPGPGSRASGAQNGLVAEAAKSPNVTTARLRPLWITLLAN